MTTNFFLIFELSLGASCSKFFLFAGPSGWLIIFMLGVTWVLYVVSKPFPVFRAFFPSSCFSPPKAAKPVHLKHIFLLCLDLRPPLSFFRWCFSLSSSDSLFPKLCFPGWAFGFVFSSASLLPEKNALPFPLISPPSPILLTTDSF